MNDDSGCCEPRRRRRLRVSGNNPGLSNVRCQPAGARKHAGAAQFGWRCVVLNVTRLLSLIRFPRRTGEGGGRRMDERQQQTKCAFCRNQWFVSSRTQLAANSRLKRTSEFSEEIRFTSNPRLVAGKIVPQTCNAKRKPRLSLKGWGRSDAGYGQDTFQVTSFSAAPSRTLARHVRTRGLKHAARRRMLAAYLSIAARSAHECPRSFLFICFF